MLDITNICRICLKEEDPKLPIFTENDEKSESKPTLPEKIMSFARVKVVKDDGLPMYICVKCYCQVDTAVEFKRLCEESFHYFKRQLDIFSNLRAISPSLQDDKENFDGYDSYSGSSDRPDYATGMQSPFSQHCIIPEECIKVENYEPECEAEEEPETQVFSISGCDKSWVDGGETEFDPAVMKCETTLDYPNIEFDLSNVKIENCTDIWSDEECVNPLELNADDFQDAKSQFFDGLISTANVEKTCKCRSCEMVFSNRREMGFHISFAHRRCNTCNKYFYSNKDKDEHICTLLTEDQGSKVTQYCHLCNSNVKQIKSHMAWHRRRTTKLLDIEKESDSEKDNLVISVQNEMKAEREMAQVKINCSLCDVVCLDEKGFKTHLKCMHADHRIIYPCFVCKSRQFFSKASCIKHLIKKHGIAANGNVRFELRHIVDCDTNARGMLKRKFTRSYYKSKKKIKTRCSEQMKESNLDGKASDQNKVKGKRMEISPRKCLKQSHPPFSLMSPVIRNNFNVTLDHKGVKRYICRGCDVMYKGYVAAYNHYYTYSKRKTNAEEESELLMDDKPYSCKFCTLKFASGSQAMMHRIHAHKYFYKKFPLDKK